MKSILIFLAALFSLTLFNLTSCTLVEPGEKTGSVVLDFSSFREDFQKSLDARSLEDINQPSAVSEADVLIANYWVTGDYTTQGSGKLNMAAGVMKVTIDYIPINSVINIEFNIGMIDSDVYVVYYWGETETPIKVTSGANIAPLTTLEKIENTENLAVSDFSPTIYGYNKSTPNDKQSDDSSVFIISRDTLTFTALDCSQRSCKGDWYLNGELCIKNSSIFEIPAESNILFKMDTRNHIQFIYKAGDGFYYSDVIIFNLSGVEIEEKETNIFYFDAKDNALITSNLTDERIATQKVTSDISLDTNKFPYIWTLSDGNVYVLSPDYDSDSNLVYYTKDLKIYHENSLGHLESVEPNYFLSYDLGINGENDNDYELQDITIDPVLHNVWFFIKTSDGHYKFYYIPSTTEEYGSYGRFFEYSTDVTFTRAQIAVCDNRITIAESAMQQHDDYSQVYFAHIEEEELYSSSVSLYVDDLFFGDFVYDSMNEYNIPTNNFAVVDMLALPDTDVSHNIYMLVSQIGSYLDGESGELTIASRGLLAKVTKYKNKAYIDTSDDIEIFGLASVNNPNQVYITDNWGTGYLYAPESFDSLELFAPEQFVASQTGALYIADAGLYQKPLEDLDSTGEFVLGGRLLRFDLDSQEFEIYKKGAVPYSTASQLAQIVTSSGHAYDDEENTYNLSYTYLQGE